MDPLSLIIAVLAFLAVVVAMIATPIGLAGELGWIGFYTGILTLAGILFEGSIGPLTKLAVIIGLLGAFGYMVYEWYSTTPLFL